LSGPRRGSLRVVASPWLLAPVAIATYLLTTFAVVASEAAFDRAASDVRAAFLAEHCPVDAVVVMGAAQYDGTPSGALTRRLALAATLIDAGCSAVVVVSGGGRPGDRTTEGEAGVAWLASRVAADVTLIAEERASTSVENLRFSRDLLPADARIIVVTDDLHAPRTRLAAAWLGLDAEVIGARVTVGRLRYALRETIGTLAYRLGAFR
jgi:uncharacterized SAM-binding protein YcdF (DUF218 family)